jgi:hypothetical protein
MGRAKRVVVVGDGPAEHREDRVADELLARAVELLDRVAHRDERRVDAAPDLLGVVLGDQPDVVDEVREQGGDDPAIAVGAETRQRAVRSVGGTRCDRRRAVRERGAGAPFRGRPSRVRW